MAIGSSVDIDALIALMIEAGLDPQQIGASLSATSPTAADAMQPAAGVPDPSQATSGPLEAPLMGLPEPSSGPLIEDSRMIGALAGGFPPLPSPTTTGQVPVEEMMREERRSGDLPGFLGLLQNAQEAEKLITESGLTELPSLQPSAPEAPAKDVIPAFFAEINDMIFGAETGQKLPEELTPEEVDSIGPLLQEAGVEPEVIEAATGQGEAGALAQESGMSIGELLLLAVGLGIGGAALGALAPETRGRSRKENVFRGALGTIQGAVGGISAFRQLERKAISSEALQQAKIEDALRKEEADKDELAARAFLDGKLDANDPANAVQRARAERFMGGSFEPAKESVTKDPTREIRDALRAARDAVDNGLPDVAAKFNALALEKSRDFSVNYDELPIDEALDTFLALRPTRPERVRSFSVLAPRLVREAGFDKKKLKELAKARGIEKEERVKEAIESALGEVSGPARGQ